VIDKKCNPFNFRKIEIPNHFTEFFKLNHRVLMRNELPPGARNIFKSLKITTPKQLIHLEDQGENP
jgi:hypothetical protein